VPPATALAAVATTGYGGYLAGPPLIGFVAEVTSLPVALAILAAVCAVIAVSAKALPQRCGRGPARQLLSGRADGIASSR
jgi:hypothetical protein